MKRWTTQIAEGTLEASEKVKRWNLEDKILYPKLIYRHQNAQGTVQVMTTAICMKCYDSQSLIDLIVSRRYRVINCWGGYQNEVYGEGPELVIEFAVG